MPHRKLSEVPVAPPLVPSDKKFTKKGLETIQDLGPNVLGPLHPVVFDVLAHLKAISGLDEVSFHMSGTEAIMCAVVSAVDPNPAQTGGRFGRCLLSAAR